jgi:hypothetical protein
LVATDDDPIALGGKIVRGASAAGHTAFVDPLATYEQDSTYDYQRGRCEVRSIKVSTEMNAYLSDWPHLAQVAQLTRTVTMPHTNRTTREIVYLITNLDHIAASPGRLLELCVGIGALRTRSILPVM